MSQTLFIDAGATKTAFAMVRDGEVLGEHIGKGINPNYTPDEEISQILADYVKTDEKNRVPTEVRYYGAGCASLENAGRVGCVLQEFFPDAKINVYSDLMAICHALSRNQRSIVGILGTGAATCLFDGMGMENRAPSLGYLLGDEGSGTNLGKRLLTAYLRGQLPPICADNCRLLWPLISNTITNCRLIPPFIVSIANQHPTNFGLLWPRLCSNILRMIIYNILH